MGLISDNGFPMLGAQIDMERYQFENKSDESVTEPDFGTAFKASIGYGVVNDVELPVVFGGLSLSTGLGFDHENFLGNVKYNHGIPYNDGNNSGNIFGTFGLRATLGLKILPILAAETGYRINSNGKDHPYVGADLSMAVYSLGIVGGFTLNPNNFGPDHEASAQNTSDTSAPIQRENGPLLDESTFFLGIRAGFR